MNKIKERNMNKIKERNMNKIKERNTLSIEVNPDESSLATIDRRMPIAQPSLSATLPSNVTLAPLP